MRSPPVHYCPDCDCYPCCCEDTMTAAPLFNLERNIGDSDNPFWIVVNSFYTRNEAEIHLMHKITVDPVGVAKGMYRIAP